MTLIATVLLSLLAATITVIIVRQTLVLTKTESTRADVSRIQVDVDEVRASFERALAADPEFYLKSTFAYERPRLCAATTPATIAQQYLVPKRSEGGLLSQTWPQSCGTSWSYPPAVAPGDSATVLDGFNVDGTDNFVPSTWSPADYPTRAEVLPPSDANPYLTLRVLSAGGQSEVGAEVRYARSAASTWTLWSSTDLDVGAVVTADTLGPSAFVYSGGRIALPTGQTTLTASVFAGEAGVAGLPLGSGARFLTGDPEQLGTPGFVNIRTAVPRPLTLEELRSSASTITTVGCPDATVAPTNDDQDLTTNYLCLAPGHRALTAQGTLVSMPDDVSAWMLVLNPTVEGTPSSPRNIAVYYAADDLQYVTDCAVACNVAAVGASLAQTSQDPAVAPGAPDSPWNLLGSFYYPQTGVVATSADTFISHPLLPSTAEASVTIMAGSAANPADIFINGNLAAVPDALVGLVASKSVRFPYFSAGTAGAVTVKAALAALGYGSGPAATTGIPQRRIPGSSAAFTAQVTGSLVTAGVEDIASTSTFSLVPDVRLRDQAPPLFPAFGNAWHKVNVTALSSLDVCQGVLEANADFKSSSCVGIW